MTKKEKNPNIIIRSIIIGLVFICFFLNIFKSYNLNAPGVFDSDYGQTLDVSFNIFEDGQFLENSTLPYSFSSSTKNKKIELVATLPANESINKSFIYLDSSGYSVIVEVENNEIYSFYEEGSKDYGGGYSHFIRLPDNSSSKQIKIKLFCPTNSPFSQTLLPIYIGSKGYLLVEAFGSTFESLFFGIILIVFGLVFLGNIIFFKKSAGNSFLLSLSLLLICLGCWVLFQSESRQIIGITNPVFPMEISFFSMFSLPFCIWFYVSCNYKKIGEYKILKYSALFIIFLYIPISVISLFGVPYTSFLAFIGILILLFTLLLLAISIKLYNNGEKALLSCIVAISSIFLSIIFEEVLLLLKISIGFLSILHTGMAITGIIFIYKSIGNLIEKTTEDNQAILLKKLAYLDVVTLVENRNSYERFLEEEGKEIKFSGIILADVNGLKIINDMYGHKSGDDLLKRLSKTLKDALPPDSKLYRVGGDEFVGIIQTLSKEEFLKFVEELQIVFTPTETDCGMAIGSYYYLKNEEEDITKAIEKADKNMYKHKEKQKNLIHKSFLVNGFIRESSLMRN